MRNKVESAYKSIYLRQTVIDELNALAAKHNTSFNNIAATMIPNRNIPAFAAGMFCTLRH